MSKQPDQTMEARRFLIAYEHLRTMRILLREVLEVLPERLVEDGPKYKPARLREMAEESTGAGLMSELLVDWHTYLMHYLDKHYPGVLEQEGLI